jgi:hypothetical protein
VDNEYGKARGIIIIKSEIIVGEKSVYFSKNQLSNP